jgi:mono/diheme cytochrome c family protein
MRRPWLITSLPLLLGLCMTGSLLLARCRKGTPARAGLEAAEETGPHAAGRKAFRLKGCARCHAVDASEESLRGPNLSKVAADPLHTPQWLAQHIRNPQSHNRQSRMPGFEGRITEEELLALSTYLSSLR